MASIYNFIYQNEITGREVWERISFEDDNIAFEWARSGITDWGRSGIKGHVLVERFNVKTGKFDRVAIVHQDGYIEYCEKIVNEEAKKAFDNLFNMDSESIKKWRKLCLLD